MKYLDTFSYFINESISKQELSKFEQFVDKLFAELGIDIVFTKHFYDRLNHPRNKKDIEIKELKDIFNEVFKKYGEDLDRDINIDAIIKSLNTKINMPFVVQWDDKNMEFDLVLKTIMRTPKFHSSDKEYKVR